MRLFNTVKWLLESGPIGRTEKIVSTGVVVGLNYLTKKATERGDFHEANHNLMALLAGMSVHEHQGQCAIPADRMLNRDESISLASKLQADGKALEEASYGLYL